MSNWVPFVAVVVLVIIGFLKVRSDWNAFEERIDFALDFLEKYRTFCNSLSNGFDASTYQWLKINSVKMQQQAGVYGIADYKPAGANYIFNNYRMILNGITEIKDHHQRMAAQPLGPLSFEVRMLSELIEAVDDVLLNYIGALNVKEESIKKLMKNPLIWLREGVRWIITSPISLMYWSGVIRYATYSKISNNFLIKSVAFLVAVIGFVSAIVTIVTGYEPFLKIMGWGVQPK